MAHLFISAAHKSSGKTTVTLGLCRALRNRGLGVQAFKKGPDYIDPIWHGLAAGRPSYNLDFHMMAAGEITDLFARHAAMADISLMEGNKGLYDGMDLEGANSNAALAKLVRAPVVLVLDTQGMTRGIAPLILGYQAFDRDVNIAGVILNKVGGPRHEEKLRAVIERYTDVRVLGAVRADEGLTIVERHLGLMPGNESEAAETRIEAIAARIADQVDLNGVLEIANRAAPVSRPDSRTGADEHPRVGPRPRIAYAHDRAFGFYYQEDLDTLRGLGVQLLPLDTLADARLPECDGLILGGGFPEMFIQALEGNVSLRADIRRAVESGLPTYAECGGLMYLSRSIRWKERRGEMVGIVPGDVVMGERPVGRGYALLEETSQAPWPPRADALPAHEFHYSRLENLPAGLNYAYRVLRGHGIDGSRDGLVHKNLLAAYCHRRGSGEAGWITPFLSKVGAYAEIRNAARLAA
ncbi:MAG: cobyrinate a,c-diamide synthase [Thiobacillaceae bacterium]|jgi:cobyrinic acid a,c-diamide synthase|nr:cobyrinate a,c-diamide synthase [Thiobacillaceae bacterium]MBP9914986.1 cobyrinate a,c-diamide synthase [Thiobacillaceae bacterium]